MDHVDVGFMACRELVPDVWDMVDHVQDAMAELLAATSGVSPAPAAKPRVAKKATAKKATAKKAPAKKAPAKKATAKKAPTKGP
jgi:topoisomerase IA-like protein